MNQDKPNLHLKMMGANASPDNMRRVLVEAGLGLMGNESLSGNVYRRAGEYLCRMFDMVDEKEETNAWEGREKAPLALGELVFVTNTATRQKYGDPELVDTPSPLAPRETWEMQAAQEAALAAGAARAHIAAAYDGLYPDGV